MYLTITLDVALQERRVNVPKYNIRYCITGGMVNLPNHNIRFGIKERMLIVPNHNIRC